MTTVRRVSIGAALRRRRRSFVERARQAFRDPLEGTKAAWHRGIGREERFARADEEVKEEIEMMFALGKLNGRYLSDLTDDSDPENKAALGRL